MRYYTFFPTPYPDESLYSVSCRYHLRSGNSSSTETIRQLWGQYLPITSVAFMRNVDMISENINPAGGLDSSKLVWEHTIYPYIYISLKEKRAFAVYQMICGSEPLLSGIDCQAGMSQERNFWKYLRYCPVCMGEDIKKYGETYWHRVHQLQGVFVCQEHGVSTCNSKVPIAMTRWRFWPASLETQDDDEEQAGALYANYDKLLSLSCDSVWLLNNAREIGCKEELTERYHSLMKFKGLMNAGSRTDYKRLCEAIEDFYGSEFLHLVLNVATEKSLLWVRKIVSLSSKGVQPIHHLLFMRFLCGTPQNFMETNDIWEPYGQSPWPCHNKICPHYLKNVIEFIEIKRNGSFCKADFICPYCGFTYHRRNPVPKEEQYDGNVKVLSYGHFWEQKLKECLLEKNLTITQTSRAMKCTKNTVYKHVERLNLIERNQPMKMLKSHPQNKKYRPELTKEQRRNAIKKIINMNPEVMRSELWRANQRDYEWLRNNDKEWFETFVPPKKDLKIDWKKRDMDWLKQIVKTYDRMAGNPDNLKRISVYSLFIEAGLDKKQIYLHKENLPRTMDFLEKNIESKDDWRKRKIDFAINKLNTEGKILSISRIQIEVGVSDKEFKKHINYVKEVLDQYDNISAGNTNYI